jgi:hypothetical protein
MDPQAIPLGLLAIEPLPAPALATVTGTVWNVAVTLFAPLIVTVHVGVVPVQAPDQPVKADRALALAVSITMVPAG